MSENIKLSIILFISLLATFSCSADSEKYEAEEQREAETQQRVASRDQECNILVIGNSLARDAFCYVPLFIEEICPNHSVNIDIMYVGGNPLSTHWNYINDQSALFTWDTYDTKTGKWESSPYILAEDIVTSHHWDIIIFQEGSVRARIYETTQPYVSRIINCIKSLQPDAIFAYLIIPSRPDGSGFMKDTTSDNEWEMNATTARQLYDEGIISHIIPCGTAIQNARHSPLDNYGDFGHLTYDGRHLQEGIPCVIDAYTATEALMKILNINSTIANSHLRITQKWIWAINVLGRHGSVIEGSDYDYALAKQCALLAIDNPYTLQQL